jgi:phage-related protein
MIFNGVSTVDQGVFIQTPPVYEFPSKKYETIQIDGKNGDLVIDKDSYSNVVREYNLASEIKNGESFVTKAKNIAGWLSSAKGYARLEDTYEPDYFRLAMFRTGGQLLNFYDKATAIVVRFECKPQRFLKSGEIEQHILETDLGNFIEIINPEDYISEPLLTIEGDMVNAEFYSGETFETKELKTSFESDLGAEYIMDSDIQECYTKIPAAYVNSSITMSNGFPKLYPGKNWIKVTSAAFVKFSIKPRWWVL